MRIDHHVSIILVVAITGSVGLAVTAGVLMGGVERAARSAGEVAGRYEQVNGVFTRARELQETAAGLSANASGDALEGLDRELERSLLETARLHHGSSTEDDRRVADAMARIETLVLQSGELAGGHVGPLSPRRLQTLQNGVSDFVRRLSEIQQSAAAATARADASLARRRQLIMIFIGAVCILYLAVIERVRHWTTKRLVHPVQTLAQVAIRALEEERSFRGLVGGSTEELNTLAGVLSSFVDTLKRKVRERTAEVERQKEHLEREVAVRRRAESLLRHASFHDKLTGLCNRDLLLDRLERCMERARYHYDYKFAVLFLDLDRFKEVNDSLGHFVGDQLLVAISERLKSCLRDAPDAFSVESHTIARIGGDEFVVLLDGIPDREAASAVARHVQEVVSEPFQLHSHEVFTSASIGIAFNEIECEKADDLLRDADTAMYHAKAAGKARHQVFDKTMHDEAMSRLQLHNDLRRAVENREFDLRYQPIVAMKSGRLAGFEALLRWQHPERGIVDPIEFVARAEETSIIVKIGEWVLDEACRQLKAWIDEGLGGDAATVSVNVSKREVTHPGYAEQVQRILDHHRLDGSHLKLEITETVIMENPDSIIEVLEELKERGVHIHMDDFGTGYSSLSYLHRFPLDLLKIDRTFLSTMAMDQDYRGIVATVVALAQTMNMQVTVEGIETEQQLRHIRALRCDYGQGFFLAPPLEVREAREMLISDPTWFKTAAA